MCEKCQKTIEDQKTPFSILSFEEYSYWEGLKNRKIILNSEIDDLIVERAIVQILRWNEEDKDKNPEDKREIEILLNSPGGQVDIGLVLCNVIEDSTTPIKITVVGTAASMAALLLISGSKHGRRYAYKFSNVLLHDGSTVLFGTSNKVKDHVKFQEEKDKQIKDFVIRNTKITPEKYDEMNDREWWLTAINALDYGIIDFVL